MDTPRAMLALAIGLLLGSVLPAEILARRRGIDIRSVGDGNPGTWNAFIGLGRAAGLATAVYDLSVGVVAIQIARLLGTSDGVAYLAGVMTVVGHRFPLLKGLRGGGRGMAASAGMVVYGAVAAAAGGWLSPADFAILAAVAVVVLGLTRSGDMVAVVMLPLLAIQLAVARPDWQLLAFMTAVTGHIWISVLATKLRAVRRRADRPASQTLREAP